MPVVGDDEAGETGGIGLRGIVRRGAMKRRWTSAVVWVCTS